MTTPPISGDPGWFFTYGMITAGDGYAYVPYSYMKYDASPGYQSNHLRLLRVDSAGAYNEIDLYDWVSTDNPDGPMVYDVNLITNADQGVVVSWEATHASADYSDWQGHMAVVSGSSASVLSVPGQLHHLAPALQLEDGSFVGTANDSGDPWGGTYHMLAFDASGALRWSVAGYTPQTATADGGVIAAAADGSAVTFDENGAATGQMASLPTQSWPGNTYRLGSVIRVAEGSNLLQSSFWSALGGNRSGNGAALRRVPTHLVVGRAKAWGNAIVLDCYSSVYVPGVSNAQRNITYHVVDQHRERMPDVKIRERLTPIGDSPCPTGTTPQNGVCEGNEWKDWEFADQQSIHPFRDRTEFTQMFWVATMPGKPNYEAYYGTITIDAYQPTPDIFNSLILTRDWISVNGNKGVTPSGTPLRRCPGN